MSVPLTQLQREHIAEACTRLADYDIESIEHDDLNSLYGEDLASVAQNRAEQFMHIGQALDMLGAMAGEIETCARAANLWDEVAHKAKKGAAV